MAPTVHHDTRVNGHLDGHWSAWFDGRQASCDDRAETTITGRVADQATLHGLPAKVRRLGLELLEVRHTDPTDNEDGATRCSRGRAKDAMCRDPLRLGHG